jgi:hypothetical protein
MKPCLRERALVFLRRLLVSLCDAVRKKNH